MISLYQLRDRCEIEKEERIIINAVSIKLWSSELNCQEKDLLYAIMNVGNIARLVDVFLVVNRLKKNEHR